MDQGWECPKCGQVYAPTVAKCETCVAVVRIPYSHIHGSGCGCYEPIGGRTTTNVPDDAPLVWFHSGESVEVTA